MPKCVQCDKFLHPDLCVVINEITGACKCVFCYKDLKELTIYDAKTGATTGKLKKKDAVKAYKEYINKITDMPNVKEILVKGEEN